MKSKGVLNIELAKMVAELGHGDMIAIVDRGFPTPTSKDVVCIDLALTRDIPKVSQVLEVLLEEIVFENKIYANETLVQSKDFYDELNSILDRNGMKTDEQFMPHVQFKKAVLSGGFEDKEIRAYIRTGEFTSYGNIILTAGVDFSR